MSMSQVPPRMQEASSNRRAGADHSLIVNGHISVAGRSPFALQCEHCGAMIARFVRSRSPMICTRCANRSGW